MEEVVNELVNSKTKDEQTDKHIAINGNDIAKYVIVMPEFNVSHLVVRRAVELANKIKAVTGMTIKWYRDYFFYEEPYEIVVGDCRRDGVEAVEDRDTYVIRSVGDKVFVNGGRNYSQVAALDALDEMLFGDGVHDTVGTFTAMSNGYKMTFCDDFDTFDEKTWSTLNYDQGSTYGRWYGMSTARSNRPENLRVEDSKLYLTATHDDKTFYGAWADTSKSMQFAKGFMEISCRLADGEGIWHDFWIFSNEKQRLEFDIAECESMGDTYSACIHEWLLDREPRVATTRNPVQVMRDRTHALETQDDWRDFRYHYEYDRAKSLNNEFHTIAAEWTDTDVYFFLDGKEVYHYEYAGTEYAFLYEKPHDFILSMLVGANQGQKPDDTDNKFLAIKRPNLEGDYWGNDRGSFIIEYLHLFQKDGQLIEFLK
ncbi:MAG: family 16 glycosylhydrolase [Clostridia bacterium]|nr:family 16 glycosylhydrolase [Clostridia bacterium]